MAGESYTMIVLFEKKIRVSKMVSVSNKEVLARWRFSNLRMHSPKRKLLTAVALSFCLTGWATALTKVEPPPLPLDLGKPIERLLTNEETHAYVLPLTKGQYAHLVVAQRGIDVVVVVFGPDGSKLFQIDSPNLDHGPEPVAIIADSPGTYRIEIKSPDKATGRYEWKL